MSVGQKRIAGSAPATAPGSPGTVEASLSEVEGALSGGRRRDDVRPFRQGREGDEQGLEPRGGVTLRRSQSFRV